MSKQTIISQLLSDFPLKQQELVVDDANFQRLQQAITLGANGSTDNSIGTTVVLTTSQDLLQLGVPNVPTVVALFSLAWQQAA
jgi:hypothetical protein